MEVKVNLIKTHCAYCGSESINMEQYEENFERVTDATNSRLKDAVGLVLEAFNLPDDVRKILETAYYWDNQ